MKGYVHIYTGNGKGKTTAAFGVALRAVCSGNKVFIGQFVKGMKYSEVGIQQHFDNIDIIQYGENCFIEKSPTEKDIKLAQAGLDKVKNIIRDNKYDVVILDELTIALYFKLIDLDSVLNLIKSKPESLELIITGRYAPQELIVVADLVTEMKEIKHYYTKGVLARKGIDC
ncbi:MAG: cob(I)yrinic acid a,c-diamide adenosyltransferase [Clostridium sp.]|uniref:cob(I)yrinic acid a,c-diamide adenosyltransferase n=1 Tax=Clostridium sp. TaxID=1506 RepID=UPI003D6C76EC